MQRCTLRKDDERPTNTVYERAGWASHMDTLWTEPERDRKERGTKEKKSEKRKERRRERDRERERQSGPEGSSSGRRREG